MQLIREWRRRALGAAIGTIVAPVAVFAAALAVGLGGGGLDALGSLGQALTGPRLPDAGPLGGPADARGQGRLLAQVRRSAADAAAGSTTVAARPTDSATPGPGGGQDSAGTGFDPADNVPPASEVSTPPPVVPTPVPPDEPTEPPSAIREAGDTVRAVTDRLPVVGAPAGQVVDGVVDTVDGILKP